MLYTFPRLFKFPSLTCLTFICFVLLSSIMPQHSLGQNADNALHSSQKQIARYESKKTPTQNYLAQNSEARSFTRLNVPTEKPQEKLDTKQKENPSDVPLVVKKRKPIITVGYEEGFGIISDSTSYAAKGYGYDLLTKFGEFADIEFNFIEIKGSLPEAVQKGIVDIGGIYSATEKRKEEFAFGHLPVHFIQYALTTKGDQGYFYDDPQSINGKTVASFEGNPGEIFLNNYLKKNNISVKYLRGNLRTFENLDADFYLFPSIKQTSEDFHSILNLELRQLYFFTRLGNEELMNYLDRKLYEFFVENVSFPEALSQKYRSLGNEFQNRSLTREEAALFKGKTFRVGYTDNHAPYQLTTLTGKPAGIAIDFMDMLAEKYDFNVEYIPYNLEASWSGFEDLDILISLIGERNHISRFYQGTDPYTSFDMNIIFQENFAAKENLDDSQFGLPQKAKVGILNYINFKYGDFFENYPTAQIVHFTNTTDLLNAFSNNEIDALIATTAGTNSIASAIVGLKYQNTLNLPLILNFQISKKISDEYLQLFNIIINKEPKTTINTIVAREISEYMPSFGTEQFIKQNMKLIIIGSIVALFFVFAFVLIVRQRSSISLLAKDDITPLKSVSQFTKEVDTILSKAQLNEYEVILLDIDYFRMINNYYGIDKGTAVIKAMASALMDIYKSQDVIMTRRIAEQFLIFKKVDTKPEIKEVVTAHIIPRVKSIVGENYSLKMSIGSCKNSEANESINEFLDNVNIAHQEAKKVHHLSFVEFNDKMREQSSRMLDIIYRMEHGIKNKEFKVHYQPKIDFKSLTTIGAEALIRWIPPIGNPIYPSDFIPLMEKNGFISQLEIYVFEEVCSFIQKNKNLLEKSKIAINISPITLSNAELIKQLIEILKQYKVSPKYIEIEITESALGDFEEVLPKIITLLHKIGFSVAMDDFGAGNSSLNRLSVIEVDVLKLDKVFLDFHEDAPRGSLVVQQVIQLAKELGMKIVAEGIEQENQAKWLKEIECDIAQGYYFAKPLKESDFVAFVQENKVYTLS